MWHKRFVSNIMHYVRWKLGLVWVISSSDIFRQYIPLRYVLIPISLHRHCWQKWQILRSQTQTQISDSVHSYRPTRGTSSAFTMATAGTKRKATGKGEKGGYDVPWWVCFCMYIVWAFIRLVSFDVECTSCCVPFSSSYTIISTQSRLRYTIPMKITGLKNIVLVPSMM